MDTTDTTDTAEANGTNTTRRKPFAVRRGCLPAMRVAVVAATLGTWALISLEQPSANGQSSSPNNSSQGGTGLQVNQTPIAQGTPGMRHGGRPFASSGAE